jgi:predicted nucleic acid-binding protein
MKRPVRRTSILSDEPDRGYGATLIPFSKPDFTHSLAIAYRARIYTYDAYVLDCAIRHKAPILTLDVRLMRTARTLNTPILEI